MIDEKQKKYLLEYNLDFDSRYDSEEAYLFSLISLRRDLGKAKDQIEKLNYQFEESRDRKLKPYEERLEKVRKVINEYGQPEKIKQKRNRQRDPHTQAVANVLQGDPQLNVDEIYHQIFECSQPGNEPVFGDRVYINRCDEESFEWRDAYVKNSKPRIAKRKSFDDLVRRAKSYLKN